MPHGSFMGGNPGWPLINDSNTAPADRDPPLTSWPMGGHMCMYYSDSPSGSGQNDWARQMQTMAREAYEMSN